MQTELIFDDNSQIINDRISLFKDNSVKGKSIFNIKCISRSAANSFIEKHHYLKDSVHPFPKFWFGLFIYDKLVGVTIYGLPQGISSVKSWFGLSNDNLNIIELTRLCVIPELNNTNATSFFLGNTIKILKSEGVSAIISLADSSKHVGSIYQVCNFCYYGLTDKKTDFYCADGRLNPRGKTNDLEGVWIERTRKHRYCYLIDKKLEVLLKQQAYPKKDEKYHSLCCGGTDIVFDNRFKKKYNCPKCNGYIKEVNF